MLLRLLVNSQLLEVEFLGNQKLYTDFWPCAREGVSAPTLRLFKDHCIGPKKGKGNKEIWEGEKMRKKERLKMRRYVT